MATSRLVVVGGNAAGMGAAHQAIRRARALGNDLEVVVLERGRDVSYSRCGIPYWIAGDVDDSDDLVARDAKTHRAMGVDLRLGSAMTKIDLRHRTVSYTDGGDREVAYDNLLLATGAAPIEPRWANADGAPIGGVHAVHTLEDGVLWISELDERALPPADDGTVGNAVIVGGGYVGVEMAEVLVRRNWRTTLITHSRLMSTLDDDMSERVAGAVRDDVTLMEHTTLASIERGDTGDVRAVVTAEGDRLPASIVLVAVGIRPQTAVGVAAGLKVGDAGGYLPDARGQIDDGVWAAGDCCEVLNRITGQRIFLPLGTHASKLGRVAGDNLAGGDATFGGAVGTAITRYETATGTTEIARTGLNSEQAISAGITSVGLVTEGTIASGYMPDADTIATKVIADPVSRRLLGVQIVGGVGAGKRIDTAAAALWTNQTIDDLAGMDLSYAPPFSTTLEAVQVAARRVADRI